MDIGPEKKPFIAEPLRDPFRRAPERKPASDPPERGPVEEPAEPEAEPVEGDASRWSTVRNSGALRSRPVAYTNPQPNEEVAPP